MGWFFQIQTMAKGWFVQTQTMAVAENQIDAERRCMKKGFLQLGVKFPHEKSHPITDGFCKFRIPIRRLASENSA
jgi:hypothetical protein